METFVTEAINIKTYPISENDNIVVMFSKTMGLTRGIAKGAKRPKSKLGGNLQTLVANTLVMGQRRNLDIIKEASPVNSFNKIRENFDKLQHAFYVLEVINNFCTAEIKDEVQNRNIYEILYKTLENIQNSKERCQTVLSTIKFQLALTKELGFGLEFERCLKCSKKPEDTVLFSLQTGGIMCMDCGIGTPDCVRLHSKIREFLSEINRTPVDKKTKYDDLVNEKVVDGCFNLLKKYIEITSNRKSKTFKVMEALKVS